MSTDMHSETQPHSGEASRPPGHSRSSTPLPTARSCYSLWVDSSLKGLPILRRLILDSLWVFNLKSC